MKIEEHIFRGIEAFDRGEQENALLHACLAIDGSSRKLSGKKFSSREDFVIFIRKYYWVLEPMVGSGLNFDETQWENLNLKERGGKPVKNKDMASVIYHIFRCNLAHGSEIPQDYKLVPRDEGGKLAYIFANDRLHIPVTLFWGLISVCVFSEVNKNIKTETNHFLTLGGNKFSISDWWGLEDSFSPIAIKHNPPEERKIVQNIYSLNPIAS